MGVLASLLGGAASNPIDQVTNIGKGVADVIERDKDRAWDKEKTEGGREWQTGERTGHEGWQSGESSKDRDWRTGEREGLEDWMRGEREGSQDWQTSEREGSQGWESGEREKSQDWASGEMGKDREQSWREQQSKQEHESGMQGSEHDWQSGENSKDWENRWRSQQSGQEHESGMQASDQAAAAAAQERDIAAKEQAARSGMEMRGYMTQGAAYGLNAAGARNLGTPQIGELKPLAGKGSSSKLLSDRKEDERAEGNILDTHQSPHAFKGWDSFIGQRSLADRGEANVLGGDTFRPSSAIRAPTKNSSALHGTLPQPGAHPTGTLPNSNRGIKRPTAPPPPPPAASQQNDPIRSAQAIVSGWDNRPAPPPYPGSAQGPIRNSRGPSRTTQARRAGNNPVSGFSAPSVPVRTLAKGKIY
nr:MAG: hypothetical protein [Wufeng shrew picorna-like virus 14]